MTHLTRSHHADCPPRPGWLLALGLALTLAGPAPARQPPSPPVLPATAPPAAMPATEAVEMFNPREVQLSWRDRRWLLVAGGRTLKDFGSRYEEARQAQRVILELGLNQRGVIGAPVPHLEYWLVDGHAPASLAHGGLRMLALEVDRLRVERVQDQWCVRDAHRVLFNFAEHAEEAKQALAVLQKYRFSHVGFVGQGLPSMMVFVGRGPGEGPPLPTTHGSGAEGRQPGVTRFSRLVKNADGTPRVEVMKASGAAASASAGHAGLVQPLIPPLAAPAGVRPGQGGESAGLTDQRSVRWRMQPHFGHPRGSPSDPADRVAFDWRQVQMRQDDGAWTLAAGGLTLARFGTDQAAARTALAAVRHYRFTEELAADGARPYFMANGAAPRGLMFGLQGEEIQPDQLQVQQRPAGFAVCQGGRVVLQFRDRPEQARQALEAIQRQRIDRVCRLGEPGKEALTILIRSH